MYDLSASKNKVERRTLREQGQDKHELAAAKANEARRKSNLKYGAAIAVIALVLIFVLLYSSAIPAKALTGVTINGEKYSVAQLNYYYSVSYNNFYSTYYSYVSYFFDTDAKLSGQMYSEDMTWQDYFIETAVDTMTQIQLLNDKADEAGYELEGEYLDEYNESLADLETSWAAYGYSSLDHFLSANYGKGVTGDLVKTEMYRMYRANAYLESVYDGFEYTDEEIASYYAENSDSYDVLSYAYYFISASEYTDAAEALEQTEAMVDAVDGTDADTFRNYVEENFDGAAIYETDTTGSNLSTVYSEWLLDSSRAAGGAAYFESDEMYYIVMYIGRDTNDYNLVSMRHLLVQAVDEDGDGVYSDEEVQASVDTVNGYYDEWLAGDATEDSFAELSDAYSSDNGSGGGLYEDIYKNQMVDPIDEWLFDESRQAGDTAVITYNEGGSYTGTHLVYFVGASDQTYAQYVAENNLRSEEYTSWNEEAMSAYSASTSNLWLACKAH